MVTIQSPLHLAVNKKNLTSIRWLIAHGVALNAKRSMWDCNHTALHMTIESGAIEIGRLLLDAGADPNIRDDKYHATALGGRSSFVVRTLRTSSATKWAEVISCAATGPQPCQVTQRRATSLAEVLL